MEERLEMESARERMEEKLCEKRERERKRGREWTRVKEREDRKWGRV